MPYRSDPSLWFNLPGVVAAWQPVAAPGPLLARYNQAHGGSNLYQAVDGVAPTWAAHTGWTFNGSSQYLYVTAAPASTWSILVRFRNVTTGEDTNGSICGALASNDATSILRINPKYTSARYFYDHYGRATVSGVPGSGVLGVAETACYRDGANDGTFSQSETHRSVTRVAIGGIWLQNYGFGWLCGADIQAVLITERMLSPVEVFAASRQMAYCHANPDWSAWGRRRRYYYAPSEATTVRWRGIGRNDTPVSGRISTGRPI